MKLEVKEYILFWTNIFVMSRCKKTRSGFFFAAQELQDNIRVYLFQKFQKANISLCVDYTRVTPLK